MLCIFLSGLKSWLVWGLWANCFTPLNLDLGLGINFLFFPSFYSLVCEAGTIIQASEVTRVSHQEVIMPGLYCELS